MPLPSVAGGHMMFLVFSSVSACVAYVCAWVRPLVCKPDISQTGWGELSQNYWKFTTLMHVWRTRMNWQWAADETTYEQGGECLLLPYTTVVPTLEFCNPERNVTSCDLTRTAHRQLQLCPHQPSNVNDCTSTACSEYHCSSCAWFG